MDLSRLQAGTNSIPHGYYLCEHPGHGLQNDNKIYVKHIETRKNSGQDIRKSPEPARCFLSNLCANLHAVAEGEHHSAVRIDRCGIHNHYPDTLQYRIP